MGDFVAREEVLSVGFWCLAPWTFAVMEVSPFEVLWEEAVTEPDGRDQVAYFPWA